MKLFDSEGIFPTVLVVIAVASSASANPTNLNPTAPLQAHGVIKGEKAGLEDAKAAVQRLYTLCQKYESQDVEMRELKQSDPTRLRYAPLAKSAAVIWKTLRDANHLELMGEPASKDLQIKLNQLLKMGNLAFFAGRNEPAAVRQRIVARLRKETPNRTRVLDQQQQRIANGQLEAAETALENLAAELWEQVYILSPKEREPYLTRCLAMLRDCDNKLDAKRRRSYLQQAKQAMTKNLEGVALFNSEATRIRGELSASGTAKIGDNEAASAADAIEYLTGLWGNASAGLLRNCAIRWAFSPSSAAEEAIKPIQQLEESAKTAIVSIIESAAAKVPAQNARALYAEILEKLAMIDRRMGSSGISGDCEQALKKLAAKDPALPAQIEAYERATAEALRWRKSFAAKQASQFRQDYVPAVSKNTQKVSIKESLKPKVYGPISITERPLLTATFGQPASWSVSEASPFLVNSRVSTARTLRVSPTSRTSIVPYGSHQYANVAVGFELQKELDALSAVLNVDDQHPALSIAAADALSSARLREFKAVGGEIQKVHLEAVVTRFIALPDAAYMLARLGSIPYIDDTSPPITQTCWRFDIQPQWVQHEYFTYAVPAVME